MKSNLLIDSRKRSFQPLGFSRPKQITGSKTDRNKFLGKEDERVYGDRFPSGFRKLKLLGKGGCALVWLGENARTGQKVAVKQVSRSNGSNVVESCKREIYFGQLLSDVSHPAVENIAKFLDFKNERHDLWAMFEVGGTSLSKALFTLKGEFLKGERVYQIHHGPLYTEFVENPQRFKAFIRELLAILDLLASLNIVHSDLKPDNILVEEENQSMKVVDFGSAFSYLGSGGISTATPEYMPPEALVLAHGPGNHISKLQDLSHPWSFDMWSTGMILLEIATGIPLWMSLKSRVCKHGKMVTCKGLLGASGRDPNTILKLQQEIVGRVEETLRKHSAFQVQNDFVYLLQRMLAWKPSERISPREALEHPFLT